MKRVLIPTDFSSCAEHAAHIGVEFAKKLGSEVCFLHIFTTPLDWNKLSLEKGKLYPETRKAIVEVKDALLKLERRAEKDGVGAGSVFLLNQGSEKIYDYISKDKYNLVVMGTYGKRGLDNFLGSNTQKVLQYSSVPVLTVKNSATSTSFEKIGIASDFEEKSRKSFNEILDLAKNLGMKTDVVYVNTPYNFTESNKIEQAMKAFLHPPSHIIQRKFVINATNEERGIGMYISSEKPDIIATITHKHSGLGNLFRPGVTQNIINHCNLPVLSINIGK